MDLGRERVKITRERERGGRTHQLEDNLSENTATHPLPPSLGGTSHDL